MKGFHLLNCQNHFCQLGGPTVERILVIFVIVALIFFFYFTLAKQTAEINFELKINK